MRKVTLEKPVGNNPYADRECPEWFRDAKLGIFIHWGPYSVPAWAPMEGALPELAKIVMEFGYDIDSNMCLMTVIPEIIQELVAAGRQADINRVMSLMNVNPYSEWYWNSMVTEGSPTVEYHKKVWGDKKYTEFGADFAQASKDWDPDTWAELFKSTGAQYVITTSKHHDGYCLWPTKYPCPDVEGWHSERDLLGELKASLKSKDMKFALYYSAGLDWALGGVPIRFDAIKDAILQSDKAIEYFDNHVKELIDRYEPDLIWEDIGYPKNGDFNAILDYYYNRVPEGVVNDRAQSEAGTQGDRHFDYTTTEYFVPQSIREVPWEICRGISNSFGYNQDDDESTTLSVEELVHSLADIVSKNGNLLLGLGPRADGSIPEHQAKVVQDLGSWMETNRDAIYGSRPYTRFRSVTNTGNDVRFTTKGDRLFAIILGPVQGSVEIEDLTFKEGASIEMLGAAEPLQLHGNAFEIASVASSAGFVISCPLKDVIG